ncbi:MAG TPA: cob(I)yrinic acid a,c-diamide adenosyltransferase [Gammaproteobacteria bacterium]
MGHRLSKIYTRTGDDGTTGLATGERVPKTDPRLAACGDVDEANSAIGVVLATPDVPEELRALLLRVQNELFEVGGALSLPSYGGVSAAHVAALEADIDRLNADLPPLKEFVLPGGGPAAAACHLARAVCRRAERSAWAAAAAHDVPPELLRYLNRLSDLLFVIARRLARASGGETLWRRG